MAQGAGPTAEEIAVRAQELKLLHLGLMLTTSSWFDPGVPILRTMLAQAGALPHEDIPVQLVNDEPDEPGREGLTFSAREVLTKMSQLRGSVVFQDLLSISMINAGIRLGDMIGKGGHYRTDVPLLQFLYHYRNACGHGDVWNYSPQGPPYPAACRGLTLTGALVGRRATWETVTPRLFVEFLDDLANHFLPGPVPPYPRDPRQDGVAVAPGAGPRGAGA